MCDIVLKQSRKQEIQENIYTTQWKTQFENTIELDKLPASLTSLAHEAGDDPVELAGGKTIALLSGAQSFEVLHRLGDYVRTQLHLDTADLGAIDVNVEIDGGVCHGYEKWRL